MTKNDGREVQRKLRVRRYAERTRQVAKTCSYFCFGWAGFYSWRRAYEQDGEARLVDAKTIPKNPPNQIPPELPEKVLQMRRKYDLGPERVMWHLARYRSVK